MDRAFVKYYELVPLNLPFLDDHQVKGVEWILTRSRSYLAHAPGAGKTITAITAAHFTAGEGQVLFIVPPSLVLNWAREIWHFYRLLDQEHEWSVGIYDAATISLKKALTCPRLTLEDLSEDFIVVSDSIITRPWFAEFLTAMKKRFVAVDEASRFKEPTAQRTIALFGGTLKDGTVSKGLVYDSRHAVLLDGSPMPNRPMELWAPTYAMAPEAIDFMNQEQFGFRYCGATLNRMGRWEFRHSAHEGELAERLQRDFMQVVTETALSHPERRRSMLVMSDDVRTREMKAWEKSNLAALKNADSKFLSEDLCKGDMASFRRELGLKKVPFIASYVADRLEIGGVPILLFCWHREVALELLVSLRKFKPGLVIGATSEKDRERHFQDFRRGKTSLLIGNIAAMGRGHNLQVAKRVVFGEFSWTDELNKQAEKRTSRRGNDEVSVRCDYIVCPNSMDEIVLRSIFRKAQTVRKVIGE